jgi:hypothetical protein
LKTTFTQTLKVEKVGLRKGGDSREDVNVQHTGAGLTSALPFYHQGFYPEVLHSGIMVAKTV